LCLRESQHRCNDAPVSIARARGAISHAVALVTPFTQTAARVNRLVRRDANERAGKP
jgi:hypothetical protein